HAHRHREEQQQGLDQAARPCGVGDDGGHYVASPSSGESAVGRGAMPSAAPSSAPPTSEAPPPSEGETAVGGRFAAAACSRRSMIWSAPSRSEALIVLSTCWRVISGRSSISMSVTSSGWDRETGPRS